MKTFKLVGAAALFMLPATAAFAVPMCDPPHVSNVRDGAQRMITQDDVIATLEGRLRAAGYDVHDSRIWNGCLQTFETIDGRDVMKFFDPDSLAELPAD